MYIYNVYIYIYIYYTMTIIYCNIYTYIHIYVCVPGFHSGERGTMTMGGEGTRKLEHVLIIPNIFPSNNGKANILSLFFSNQHIT